MELRTDPGQDVTVADQIILIYLKSDIFGKYDEGSSSG